MDQTLDQVWQESLAHLGQAITGGNAAVVAAVQDLRPRTRSLSLSATAIADATGTALLVFSPVPQGEQWDLYRLVIGGATWATAAAGSAVAYTTSGVPQGAPGLTSVIDEAVTLPDVAFYLAGQAPLFAGEALAVSVTGGTVGQQYLAHAQFTITPQ